ncbi:hypothetical protein ABPG72_022463 [Tetrahymena utriculariae]
MSLINTPLSFNLPHLPFDCQQALAGAQTSPDDGYVLKKCNSGCMRNTDSSIISFLMDRRTNKSGDLLLNYKIDSQINYPIIQVDFFYITDGDFRIIFFC